MKKNIIGIYVTVFVLSLFGGFNVVFAATPTFQTEAEVDAYYDAQKLQVKEKYEEKNQAIIDQMNIDIKNNHEYFDAQRLKLYKEVFGENVDMEMVKPYLKANNPNPEIIYQDVLHFPTINGINKHELINFVNPDLYKKISDINKQQSAIIKEKSDKLNQEVCISDFGPYGKWDGVRDNSGKINCNCLNGYVIGKDKKCILKSINDTKIVTNITSKLEASKEKSNVELPKETIAEKEMTNSKPIIKVKWYQKIFNWFKGK